MCGTLAARDSRPGESSTVAGWRALFCVPACHRPPPPRVSDHPTPLPWPRVLPLGDAALTVVFGDRVAADLHARVMGLAARLTALQAAGELPGVREWVPAFASVTVHLEDRLTLTELSACEQRLLALARDAPALRQAGRRWRLPVCFDEDLSPDLAPLAATCGLSVDAVIRLLTATRFRVYMLGFLPGFPYLGDLPDVCAVPRRSSPRARVPERSVAVAGRLCAVYPWESPGGWHLLGRTPVRLFDAAAAEPALLRAGDELEWLAIDRRTYEDLDARAAAGQVPRDAWRAPEAT